MPTEHGNASTIVPDTQQIKLTVHYTSGDMMSMEDGILHSYESLHCNANQTEYADLSEMMITQLVKRQP